MPMRTMSLAGLGLVLWAGAVSAQTLKPGLWETQAQVQGARGAQMAGAMADMQKQLASMPPEQRKMVEGMMAKQGVQMGSAPGGGMTVKICLTQAMIERNDIGRQQGDCSHTMGPRSGNSMKFSYSCPRPPSRGEGTITFTSPEAYSVKMQSTTTLQGKEETVEMQSSARWLGSDCGSVRPLGAAAGK